MSSKKYTLSIVGCLYTFIIANLILWYGFVNATFTQRDLNRLGSFLSTEPLTQDIDRSRSCVEFADYIRSGRNESFDVITIGDSFTQKSYQFRLAEKYGLKILNARFMNNSLEDLYVLIQSGMLDEIKPMAVILENVERDVQSLMGREEIGPMTRSRAEGLVRSTWNNRTASSVSSGLFPPVMFQANNDFLHNKFVHMNDPERLSTKVYITELTQNFFTNRGQENLLLYYYVDLEYLNNPVNAEMVNRNLNNAAKLLRDRNIKLIFFAGVDKYDLYYPYIKDKRNRPENNFFPEMRRVSPQDYVFIDSMKILREAIEHGEQDIYWLGDTHWSWKGMQLVADEIARYIVKLPVLNHERDLR